MEALVDVLASVVAKPLDSPFRPETILVASKGMERWLSMQLAERFGIWTNARYPFPRAFIDEVLAAVLGEPAVEHGFSRETLRWCIARLLPERVHDPAFAPIASYLRGDDALARRFQLADRVANVFDQYAVYRPELVLSWEAGEDDDWQAVLWRLVTAELGGAHLPARVRRFFERVHSLDRWPEVLPPRISIVGVSSLPPIYLRVLSELGKHLEAHLFLLSPSREYTGELRSRRELARQLRAGGTDAEDFDSSEGNALLGSLGRAARDFQQLLETVTEYTEPDHDLFREPRQNGMLDALQSDVLWLRQRSVSTPHTPPVSIDAADRSVEIHRCHSPMRQAEVLRDQLLGMFDADPSLRPSDVIVMMPNVEAFAPLIDAVFNVNPLDPTYIPYRIADRTPRGESSVVQAFTGLIDICRGRAKASELLDLLQLEPVRNRFGIRAEQLPTLQRWVHEAGIRWGVDADDRARMGQPPYDENTWAFGLRRLLLGYALPGRDSTLFQGTLGYDDVEGENAELLGKLVDYCQTAFYWRKQLAEDHTVVDWHELLLRMLSDVVATDPETAWQTQLVSTALSELREHAAQAGFDEQVPIDVVASVLTDAFETQHSSHDFLSGGVTFCAMLPMRSIPFRVVCLLGLDDGSFPRTARSPSFDRMAAQPQLGDRSVRHEDRYLFLEALLSARDKLLLTYVGQGIQDGAERPPSVVVGELLDVMVSSFRQRSGGAGKRKRQAELVFESAAPSTPITDHVVVTHPLQAFSPKYFDAEHPRLFSYGQAEAEGADSLRLERSGPRVFQPHPLPVAIQEPRRLLLTDLTRFFENPARALLQSQLGLYLDDDPTLVEDREPLEPEPLERYGLGSLLLERALRGADVEAESELLRAKGVLPLGAVGAFYYSTLLPEVEAIASAARPILVHPLAPEVGVELELRETRLYGSLRGLYRDAMLSAQYSRLRPKHELSLWIRHLVLHCVRELGHPTDSVIVGRPADPNPKRLYHLVRFRAVDRGQARLWLADFIDLYWSGQSVPLCLFPDSSKTFAAAMRGGPHTPERLGAALEAAADKFRARPLGPARGEADDDYVRRVFGDVDLTQSEGAQSSQVARFRELACRVFDPLLDHLEGPS
jgi:exodeoxyribonuclease V gamma subunit